MDDKEFEELMTPSNYVELVGTDKNFFKVLPNNIGELQYCRTTNPQAEQDTPQVRRKKTLMAIGIPIAIVGVLAAIFNDSPIFIGIVAIIAIIVIVMWSISINSFKGQDYFVGSEGYARAEFDGDRKNAKIIEEERFEKFADFVSKEIEHRRNGQYEITEVSKYFFSPENADGKRQCLGGWEGNLDRHSEEYLFMKDVESAWSVFHFNRLKEKLASGIPVTFNVYSDDGFISDYFVFEGSTLKVGERVYDKATLKDVRIGNGVLVIEHVNHSSKLFGLIKKGNQEEIPFSMIANSKVFMLFFEDFVARTLK